jgi:ABC-type lipoprotein release transport system permease subunit
MLLLDLQIAGRNLTRHTKRNLFLGGAIGAVTALLVLMGGLSAGIRATLFDTATTIMTGHVNVGGFYKTTSGTGAPMVIHAAKVLAASKSHVPELDYAILRVRGYAKAVSEKASMDIVLNGIDIGSEPRFLAAIQMKEGRIEDLAKPDTILLFEEQAKRLEVKTGDQITIAAPTTRGANNTADLRVVGVGRGIGMMSAIFTFLPADTLRKLYQVNADTTGAVHLYLRAPAKAAQVAERLREALAKDGFRVMAPEAFPYWEKFQRVNSEDWTGQKLDVTTWEDELSFMNWILTGLAGLTGLLSIVLLAIVVIGILNTLAIAIRERTREIGTLRAIGMQRTKVLWLFLLEAMLLGLLGTTGGALAGWLVALGINAARLQSPESVQMFLMQRELSLSIDPASVAQQVALITLVTTLAAFFPALRAARLKPVTAMHHFG